MKDMSTKSQNINTSAERVHKSDKSIHEQWDTTDMAHRPGGLTIDDDDIQEYKKPWVGLTDEEVHEAAIKCVKSGQSVDAAIRAIEAKLKEKNNV